MEIAKSNIVRSDAGRDKGKLFVVLATEGEYLLLADGKSRKVESPKRKKRRHVLFVAADEINSRIIEETGNPLGYWSELSEIPAAPDAEMAAALKDLDIYFGLDFSARGVLNAAAFRSAADACMSGYTDELRALAQAGISASTILGDENRQLRLDYLAFVSADILIDLVEDIFSGSTETIDGLLSGVVSLLASRAEALQKQFSAAFSQAREAISSAAYADFLVRIGVR